MNSKTPIQQTYKGVTITYDEDRNRWLFTLRGSDKSSESLSFAREVIDKPAPKNAKPFEKISAWWCGHNDDPQAVTVTGIGEPGWRGTPQVWIKHPSGRRSKEDPEHKIYPSNSGNDALIEKIQTVRKAIAKLEEEGSALRAKLAPLNIQPIE